MSTFIVNKLPYLYFKKDRKISYIFWNLGSATLTEFHNTSYRLLFELNVNSPTFIFPRCVSQESILQHKYRHALMSFRCPLRFGHWCSSFFVRVSMPKYHLLKWELCTSTHRKLYISTPRLIILTSKLLQQAPSSRSCLYTVVCSLYTNRCCPLVIFIHLSNLSCSWFVTRKCVIGGWGSAWSNYDSWTVHRVLECTRWSDAFLSRQWGEYTLFFLTVSPLYRQWCAHMTLWSWSSFT